MPTDASRLIVLCEKKDDYRVPNCNRLFIFIHAFRIIYVMSTPFGIVPNL